VDLPGAIIEKGPQAGVDKSLGEHDVALASPGSEHSGSTENATGRVLSRVHHAPEPEAHRLHSGDPRARMTLDAHVDGGELVIEAHGDTAFC
jgi:hypothetical protein